MMERAQHSMDGIFFLFFFFFSLFKRAFLGTLC